MKKRSIGHIICISVMLFLAGLSGRKAKDAEWTKFYAQDCYETQTDWHNDYKRVIKIQDSTIASLNKLITEAELENTTNE